MSKAYLFVFDATVGKQEQIKDLLSKIPAITAWRFDLPNSFYLISDLEARPLAESLRNLLGDKGRFVVTEISSNRWGWLTEESWYLITNKDYKPKEKKT